MRKLLGAAFVALLLVGCGGDEETVVVKKKPYGGGGGDDPKPVDVQALVDAECNRCHGKSVGSALAAPLKAGAKQKVLSGNMPPDKKLSDDVKQKLAG